MILDELDKHPEIWDVLYTLTRAKSKDDTETNVVVIGISNDIHFKNEIEARVDSTLQPEHKVFSPYSESQLTTIMQNRSDAFQDDVLQSDVIPTAAEVANAGCGAGAVCARAAPAGANRPGPAASSITRKLFFITGKAGDEAYSSSVT